MLGFFIFSKSAIILFLYLFDIHRKESIMATKIRTELSKKGLIT